MKKLFIVAFVLMSIGTTTVFAQIDPVDPVEPVKNDTTVVDTTIVNKDVVDDFVKIEISELPETVQMTVNKEFAESTIKEAFVAIKGEEETLYKVVLVSKEGEEVTVIFNEKGEIKE